MVLSLQVPLLALNQFGTRLTERVEDQESIRETLRDSPSLQVRPQVASSPTCPQLFVP